MTAMIMSSGKILGYRKNDPGQRRYFSCEWENINNILFRKGRKFNQTQTHQEIGNFMVEFGVDYQPR